MYQRNFQTTFVVIQSMTNTPTSEDRKAKARQASKDWLAKKTPEERKDYYSQRYLRNKVRYNAQSKAWAKSNPHKSQASVHQNTVKRLYPTAYAAADFTTAELADWLKHNRGTPCKYCGQAATHIDHVHPLSRGGAHQWSNLVMACEYCNVAKSTQTPEEFLTHIKLILDFSGTSVV